MTTRERTAKVIEQQSLATFIEEMAADLESHPESWENPDLHGARQARKLTRSASVGSDRPGWADLLKRVFAVDGWACPHCTAPMRLRSIVIHPPATTRVLRGLLRATGPPGEGGEGDVGRAFSVA